MTAELLTDDELELMDLLGKTAGLFRRVIGSGLTADLDWLETAHEIHVLQQRVMSQAAARAYPDILRLLGGTVRPGDSA